MTTDALIARIYGLEDPRDGAIRYIGKTVQPLAARLQQHIYPARVGKHGHSKAHWIRELLAVGSVPFIRLLEEVPAGEWREAERRWAERLRVWGQDLTNEAPEGGGGDSSHKGRMTPEITAMLGQYPDDELALIAGLTRKAIAYHRRVRGIEPCGNRPNHRVKPPLMAGHNRKELPPSAIDRLGKEPDYRIANDFGVTKPVIARLRAAKGVASYAESTGVNGRFEKGNYPARWKTK